MTDPPCGFTHRGAFHRPKFYRYQVANPGFRLVRNRYTSTHSTAFIGLALVAGRWAWCVKWADAKVILP